ncbi:MAG: LicD family protein, partial [Clostridia bacterium]|nr:LicD family protein [Clostridia bacterium]
MNKLQQQLFPLLCEVDHICREFGIHYTLQGGTLLGAVRENGFISWDDDVDIAMSRENYERFIEVFPAH